MNSARILMRSPIFRTPLKLLSTPPCRMSGSLLNFKSTFRASCRKQLKISKRKSQARKIIYRKPFCRLFPPLQSSTKLIKMSSWDFPFSQNHNPLTRIYPPQFSKKTHLLTSIFTAPTSRRKAALHLEPETNFAGPLKSRPDIPKFMLIIQTVSKIILSLKKKKESSNSLTKSWLRQSPSSTVAFPVISA